MAGALGSHIPSEHAYREECVAELNKSRAVKVYCFSGLCTIFAKFVFKNCAKIVSIQVLWQAKTWAKCPSSTWVCFLKSMGSWSLLRLECEQKETHD